MLGSNVEPTTTRSVRSVIAICLTLLLGASIAASCGGTSHHASEHTSPSSTSQTALQSGDNEMSVGTPQVQTSTPDNTTAKDSGVQEGSQIQPCSVFSVAQVNAITGAEMSVGKASSTNESCDYVAKTQTDRTRFMITVLQADNAEKFTAAKQSVGSKVVDLTGVGDEAFSSSLGDGSGAVISAEARFGTHRIRILIVRGDSTPDPDVRRLLTDAARTCRFIAGSASQ